MYEFARLCIYLLLNYINLEAGMGVDDLAKYLKNHCIGEEIDLNKPPSGLSINEVWGIDLSVFLYRWKGNDAALDCFWVSRNCLLLD